MLCPSTVTDHCPQGSATGEPFLLSKDNPSAMDNPPSLPGRKDLRGCQDNPDLEKLLGLLNDEDTKLMYDRHALALKRICRNNEGGFWVGDLPQVQKVLELSLVLVKKGRTEFVQPLCNLLR